MRRKTIVTPTKPRADEAAAAGGTPAGGSGIAPPAPPAGLDVPGAAAAGGAGEAPQGCSQPLGFQPRTWTVALPAGLETLSLNGRLHWAQQRRRAAEIKKAAWAMALNQKIPLLNSASVKVVYHPPDRRRRDHDNIPAAMGKHAIDGLVAAVVLLDDCPPNVASVSYAIGEIVKRGQLVLHITEVGEPQ